MTRAPHPEEHDETSYDCWCCPLITHPCSACEGASTVSSNYGCWKCNGAGFEPCDSPTDCDEPHVVAHRYPRGTPGACYFLEDETNG